MKIEVQKTLTPKQIKILKKLCFSWGNMIAYLTDNEEICKARTHYLIAYKGDKIVGWATLYFHSPRKRTEAEFNVYVRRHYRRKGIGTALVEEARQICKNLVIHPHSTESEGFFGSMPDKYFV